MRTPNDGEKVRNLIKGTCERPPRTQFSDADPWICEQGVPMPDNRDAVSEVQTRQKSTELAIKCVGIVGLGHMGHAFATNLV